ncbi:uncharacterized protein YutE (UPF0331/DUF86 family) [Hydrogenispora ethanolica]|uniref:Uncharacterized protein YutE (UPF0331/DUF86 family) n=1 Tax=Hydrogenispora ethanolica TaxID=1082276 RepID=A0A4R1S4K7_HYDET|nr:DUF86 domain-containing protein [Hydrogenispora ethanolica]TCL73322.1 uncharacterized protein YutE (UPF0331/DUF86 family) [Hydrogenispora ethanolica]
MKDNMAICSKLERLAGYYQELKQLTAGVSLETYLQQTLLKRAVEREIQLIVECATDVNNMILKKLGKGPAKDYFNTFLELAEAGVLAMEFALQIAPSTGLRNILVHEYQTIDDTLVYQSIGKVLRYYQQYLETVAKYLGCW